MCSDPMPADAPRLSATPSRPDKVVMTPSATESSAAATESDQPITCLTVDVEEYFHAEAFAGCLRPADWDHCERRAAPFLERIAELLARYRAPATFFVLGWMAERIAPLLRGLLAAGHEIACHGDGHAHLSRMTQQGLRDDLRRASARIEDAVGVTPVGYRAPTFSVTRKTAWALDVVIEHGFRYDASIFPIRHDRYGVPDAPTKPHRAIGPAGHKILEIPPLTMRLWGANLPVGGGGYLRLLPIRALDFALKKAQSRDQIAMIYLHPWELDPSQPNLPLKLLSRWRHRVGLSRTESKLSWLLKRHKMTSVSQLIDYIDANTTESYTYG